MKTGALSASQQSARREIEELVDTLQLPERGTGMAHLQARHEWFHRIAGFYRQMGATC